MSIDRRRARAMVAAAMTVAVLALGGVAPSAVSAAVPHTSLTIGGCSSFTDGLPVNKQIRFTLLRPNGTQKAAKTVNSGDGSIEIDCLATFAIGDKLVIRRVNGPVLRTITIPRVTISMNRTTGKASGKAPGGRSARLLTGPCKPSTPMGRQFCSSLPIQADFTIPSSGTWSKSGTGIGYTPVGGDQATLFVFTPQDDRFAANDRANVVEVRPGSAVVRGIGKPGATVTATLKDGSVVRGTGSATANKRTGAFVLTLRKNGNAVLPELGDEVIVNVASDASFVIGEDLALDLSDVANDHVQGTCFADGAFEVSMVDGDGTWSSEGVADANGAVDVPNFTSGSGITPGLTVQLRCLTAAGDRVLLQGVVP